MTTMPQMEFTDQEKAAFERLSLILANIPPIHRDEIPSWIVKDKETIARLFPMVSASLGLPAMAGRLPDEIKISPFVMMAVVAHALTGKALVPIFRKSDNALVSFSWWGGATPAMMAQARTARASEPSGGGKS